MLNLINSKWSDNQQNLQYLPWVIAFTTTGLYLCSLFNRRENTFVNEDHIIVTTFLRFTVGSIIVYGLYKFYLFLIDEYKIAQDIRAKNESNFNEYDYFLYRVDFLFSTASDFKIRCLLFATTMLILIGGFLVFLATGKDLSECFWSAWTYIADPGTHADSSSGLLRLVSFCLTLGGMVIFALVIGIVSGAVGDYVENLRKGKSRIVESGHTLILGQGDKLIPTIKQICLANISEGGGLIVVLTKLPKQELETQIEEAMIDFQKTRVIVRSGFPHVQQDLKRVSALTARSIIILSDRVGMSSDAADVQVVRTVLNLRALILDSPTTSSCSHITCDVCDIDNEELVSMVGDGLVETVVSHDIVGRLMLQCSLRPGLSPVLDSLLGFDGCEFYLSKWPTLTGRTFGDLMFSFDAAIVVGIMSYSDEATQDSSLSGKSYSSTVHMNPSVDTILGERDKVIVIAEDNDSYKPIAAIHIIDEHNLKTVMAPHLHYKHGPQKVLLVGWRRDMDYMIEQVNAYVHPGSELTIACQLEIEERKAKVKSKDFEFDTLNNITIKHFVVNPTLRKDLEPLPLAMYDSILVLADEDLESSENEHAMIHADSRSLTSLILIRDIQRKQRALLQDTSKIRKSNAATNIMASVKKVYNSKPFHSVNHNQADTFIRPELLRKRSLVGSDITAIVVEQMLSDEKFKLPRQPCLVSEILDPRTKSVISVASMDDYVASNEIISMILAMVSEQREVNTIFKELFSANGNEIFLRPITDYILPDKLVSFQELQYIGKRNYNHLIIGYKTNETKGCVVLNPHNRFIGQHWISSTEIICIHKSEDNLMETSIQNLENALDLSNSRSPLHPTSDHDSDTLSTKLDQTDSNSSIRNNLNSTEIGSFARKHSFRFSSSKNN